MQQFYKRRPITGVELHSSSHTADDADNDDDDDTRRYHGNSATPAAESAHRLQPTHDQYVCPSVSNNNRNKFAPILLGSQR